MWNRPPEPHESLPVDEDPEPDEPTDEFEPEDLGSDDDLPVDDADEAEDVEAPAVEPRHRARGRGARRLRRGRHAPGAHAQPSDEPLPGGEHERVDESEDFDPGELDRRFGAPSQLGELPVDEPASVPRAGSRRLRTQRKRRRSFAARAVAGLGTGALIAALLFGGSYLARKAGDDPRAGRGAGANAAKVEPITTLMFGTRERQGGDDQDAIWLMLFTYDPRDGEGSVIHVPAHTAAEVPGRGLEALNTSYSSGGIPLLLVSVENLLGIEVDRYLELSDKNARVLFTAAGPFEVNVPEDVRVPAGRRQVRLVFSAGRQELAAPDIVRLMYTRGSDVDDIDFGSRLLAVWDGVFDRFENDPRALSKAVTSAGAALIESDADAEQHARFFSAIADLPRIARTISALPVRGVAAGDDELYATDATELREFVAANLEGGRAPEDEVRVQILNGNGEPGIGQEVADRLVGEGFRVILSGNARRLDYARTLIVTYDSSAEGQALAERARSLLGVGEVQVSAQQQGIVDLTIVVGEDFLTTL